MTGGGGGSGASAITVQSQEHQRASDNTMSSPACDSNRKASGLCLTCGSVGASVSVYTRLGNTEPLLSVLGQVLQQPLSTIILHSTVVCTPCQAHLKLMHGLMVRLAELSQKTSDGYHRTVRLFAKHQQEQESQEQQQRMNKKDDNHHLEDEGLMVTSVMGQTLAMANSAGRSKQMNAANGATQRKYECHVCGKKFRAYSHRVEHMLIHTGERPHQCSECGFQAATKSNLVRHQQRHNKQTSCHICGKTLANKFTLKEHLKSHEGLQPHQCQHCQKTFLRRWEMQVHERSHGEADAQWFECPKCQRRFVLRSRLERHLLVHQEHKQFVCDICSKQFARKDDLKCHQRTHTGEKPYPCPLCGRTFRFMSNCRSHIRIHQRQNWSCSPCNMTFVSSAKYSIHLKSRSHRRRCNASEGEERNQEEEGRKEHGGEDKEGCKTTTEVTEMVCCEICGITFDSIENLSTHTLTTHINPPIIPTNSDTSIIISTLDVTEEGRELAQDQGVSMVVTVDRDGATIPTSSIPHSSSSSNAFLTVDKIMHSSSPCLFPFTLDSNEVSEVVGEVESTILTSLTDGEERTVGCTGVQEDHEIETNKSNHLTTPLHVISSMSSHNPVTTIATTSVSQMVPPQRTFTIISSTNTGTVFRLTNCESNE